MALKALIEIENKRNNKAKESSMRKMLLLHLAQVKI